MLEGGATSYIFAYLGPCLVLSSRLPPMSLSYRENYENLAPPQINFPSLGFRPVARICPGGVQYDAPEAKIFWGGSGF